MDRLGVGRSDLMLDRLVREEQQSGTVVGIESHVAACLSGHVPGQERIDVDRDLAAVLSSLEVLGPMHGPSVHGLPISHLLPQFGELLAKLKDFVPKLPHQFGQIGWLKRQEWVDKRVFHDREACNPDLPSMKSPSVSTKNGMGEALQAIANGEWAWRAGPTPHLGPGTSGRIPRSTPGSAAVRRCRRCRWQGSTAENGQHRSARGSQEWKRHQTPGSCGR